MLHHKIYFAKPGELHLRFQVKPPFLYSHLRRLAELSGRPHAPQARCAAKISSGGEKSATTPGVGPDVREINCRLRRCSMLGAHTSLAGSNIFICVRAHTNTHKPGLPLPLTGRIYQHVKSQMNIKPPHPPPSEVLLLCLQVALPGILPAASRFHVARGIILPFVCVCASAGVYAFCTEVWRLHKYYLSYVFFLFWHRASQSTSQVAGWPWVFKKKFLLLLFLPPAGLPSKASSLQPAGDYEKSSQRSNITRRLPLSG